MGTNKFFKISRFKNIFISCVTMVLACCLLSSCIRVASKVVGAIQGSDGGLVSDKDTNSAAIGSAIESKIYTSHIGDTVVLKLSSNLLFIENTANNRSGYYSNMQDLAKYIAKFEHSYIHVTVDFQDETKNSYALQVAGNQAKNIVSNLSQFLSSSFSTSSGGVVLKSEMFNKEYNTVGNYIEITLS